MCPGWFAASSTGGCLSVRGIFLLVFKDFICYVDSVLHPLGRLTTLGGRMPCWPEQERAGPGWRRRRGARRPGRLAGLGGSHWTAALLTPVPASLRRDWRRLPGSDFQVQVWGVGVPAGRAGSLRRPSYPAPPPPPAAPRRPLNLKQGRPGRGGARRARRLLLWAEPLLLWAEPGAEPRLGRVEPGSSV